MAKNPSSHDNPGNGPGSGVSESKPPLQTAANKDPQTGDEKYIPLFEKATQALGRSAAAEQDQFTYAPVDLSRAYDPSSPSTGPGTGGLTQLAQDTIRQALGWRYRTGDVKGFSAAINRAFTLTQDQDGVVDWTWTPQTYAIQADLGEITGAQASILEQAKNTINYVLPLLDGLQALRTDSDTDDIAAVSGIVRMKLTSMLAELARVGGPRVQRMDLLFEELLGLPLMQVSPGRDQKNEWVPFPVADSDDWINQLKALDQVDLPQPRPGYEKPNVFKKTQAYSLLRQLSEELGLDPQLANTVEEERDFTNYMILVDSTISLRTAWIGKRKYFYRFGSSPTFLGTQLVWLSRQIEVVAETVRAAYAAMDSVFFGPQERQATDIYFSSQDETLHPDVKLKEAAITVGDLLDWVETFATQEGPQLLQDGGKDGVLSFRSTVKRLEEWVEAAARFSEGGPGHGHAPRSFFTTRVSRALRDIELQLDATAARTEGISRSTRTTDAEFTQIANLPKPLTSHVRGMGYLNGQENKS